MNNEISISNIILMCFLFVKECCSVSLVLSLEMSNETSILNIIIIMCYVFMKECSVVRLV